MAFIFLRWTEQVNMFSRAYIHTALKKPTVLGLVQRPLSHNFYYLHRSTLLCSSRRKDHFSSKAYLLQRQTANDDSPTDETATVSSQRQQEIQRQRKRGVRSPAAPTSLRRVAVEAQRSKSAFLSKTQLEERGLYQTKVCCVSIESMFKPHLLTNTR